MWGNIETESGTSHYCFTSFQVEEPAAGRLDAALNAKSDYNIGIASVGDMV